MGWGVGSLFEKRRGSVTLPLRGLCKKRMGDGGWGHLHHFGGSVQELNKCAIFVIQRKCERVVNYQTTKNRMRVPVMGATAKGR